MPQRLISIHHSGNVEGQVRSKEFQGTGQPARLVPEAEQRHVASFLAVLFPGLDEREGVRGPPGEPCRVRPLLATASEGKGGGAPICLAGFRGQPLPTSRPPWAWSSANTHPPTGTLSLHGRKKHTGHIFSCQKVIK